MEFKFLKSISFTNMLTAQIARFCANYGSWGGEKVTHTEWNLELINSMVYTMSSQWDIYTETSAATLADLKMRILGLLDGLILQVEGTQSGKPMQKPSFH